MGDGHRCGNPVLGSLGLVVGIFLQGLGPGNHSCPAGNPETHFSRDNLGNAPVVRDAVWYGCGCEQTAPRSWGFTWWGWGRGCASEAKVQSIKPEIPDTFFFIGSQRQGSNGQRDMNTYTK